MSTPPDNFLSAPELPAGVEPRRPPPWKPWMSVAALVTGFAGALLGALIIGVIAATVGGASIEDPPPVVSIIGTIWQDLCLIGAALLYARMVVPPRPSHFGLRPTRIGRAIGLMALTWVSFWLFTAAFVAILGLSPDDDQLPQELGVEDSTLALVAVAFLVCVVAPVAEEFFFRGFFFTRAAQLARRVAGGDPHRARLRGDPHGLVGPGLPGAARLLRVRAVRALPPQRIALSVHRPALPEQLRRVRGHAGLDVGDRGAHRARPGRHRAGRARRAAGVDAGPAHTRARARRRRPVHFRVHCRAQ